MILDRRGIAALEFVVIAPALLTMLASLADFGLALRDRTQLAAAVDAGAAYAFAQGQAVADTTQSVSATDVQAKVLAATALGATVSVTGPATYCIVNAALTAGTAGTACPNGNPPGTYMIITASFRYRPMLPVYSLMAATTLTETASVRLY
jgi:Flp pilus assembly protein TadG